MKPAPETIRNSVILHSTILTQSGLSQVLKSTPVPAMNIMNDTSCTGAIHYAPTQNTIHTLEHLRDHIGPCTRCKLHKGRNKLVFGMGNSKAKLMFVGEGPGADEDEQGVPFVGRAGQLLTKMIEAMGLKRDAVYIANVVKCRPPNNRNPEPDEIESCMPFLENQIRLVHPRVVVCLGKFAAQTVLKTDITISKLRGHFYKHGDFDIMPTFHPSYLLRNPAMKKFVWEDLKQVMAKLKG